MTAAKSCDYPPCPESAVAEVRMEGSAKTAWLCVEHAAYAAGLLRKFTAMSDDEYVAYIRDLVDQAPALDDTQRARLSYLLRAHMKGKS